MLRRACFGLCFAMGLALTALGQTRPDQFKASNREVRQQVVAVIEAQLEAFRAGRVAEAYQYAAADLRAQTPPRAFGAIVRENYPVIWKNTRAEYGIVRDDGRYATVLVHVYSAAGDAPYDYVLIKERNGWRIASVTRHEARRQNNV